MYMIFRKQQHLISVGCRCCVFFEFPVSIIHRTEHWVLMGARFICFCFLHFLHVLYFCPSLLFCLHFNSPCRILSTWYLFCRHHSTCVFWARNPIFIRFPSCIDNIGGHKLRNKIHWTFEFFYKFARFHFISNSLFKNKYPKYEYKSVRIIICYIQSLNFNFRRKFSSSHDLFNTSSTVYPLLEMVFYWIKCKRVVWVWCR